MKYIISCILIFLINASCAGKEIAVKIDLDDIQGYINNQVEVTVFDGTSLKTIPVSGNRIFAPHGITPDYSGVLYFARKGFYPETVIFKTTDRPVTIENVSLLPLRDKEKGVLTGVVYKPVTGGKLKEHKGIARMYKGENVRIIKNGSEHETVTDDKGVFMIELLPGEYDIGIGNTHVRRTLIVKGRTTLENFQKGVLLVD